jgi:hypothetical protein
MKLGRHGTKSRSRKRLRVWWRERPIKLFGFTDRCYEYFWAKSSLDVRRMLGVRGKLI